MKLLRSLSIRLSIALTFTFFSSLSFAAGDGVTGADPDFPPSLASYGDAEMDSVTRILSNRIEKEPFNLFVSIVFLLAVCHAFTASKIAKIAHDVERRHHRKKGGKAPKIYKDQVDEVSVAGQVLHFLGEVEAIFGIWILVLLGGFVYYKDLGTFVAYVDSVNYTEAMFVVVIMALSASRPVIHYSEKAVGYLSALIGGKPWAYWVMILTVCPVLGSFITEPAAMTIAAVLLSKKIYARRVPPVFAYATLGLLFVNISIGGTLTNFAAPPVLMVANAWEWSTGFMLVNFGWKAVLGILASNAVYFFAFRKTLFGLRNERTGDLDAKPGEIHWEERNEHVPFWVFFAHVLFIFTTVVSVHHPKIFVGVFLFFLAFTLATVHHQNKLSLRSPILVGFFLAGLVTHGGLQGWWIAPVLASLEDLTLFWGALALTAFNDNAAITYLSTLVPGFSDSAKYAVVSGAVIGGGLTVIANAPNPAGQAILSKHFKEGVNPLKLAMGAILPTLLVSAVFLLL